MDGVSDEKLGEPTKQESKVDAARREAEENRRRLAEFYEANEESFVDGFCGDT